MAKPYVLAAAVLVLSVSGHASLGPHLGRPDGAMPDGGSGSDDQVCVSESFCLSYRAMLGLGLAVYVMAIFASGVFVAVLVRAGSGRSNLMRRLCDWCSHCGRNPNDEGEALVPGQPDPTPPPRDLTEVVTVQGPEADSRTMDPVPTHGGEVARAPRLEVGEPAENPPIVVDLHKWRESVKAAGRRAGETASAVDVHASPKRKIAEVDPPAEDRPTKTPRSVELERPPSSAAEPVIAPAEVEIGPADPRSPPRAVAVVNAPSDGSSADVDPEFQVVNAPSPAEIVEAPVVNGSSRFSSSSSSSASSSSAEEPVHDEKDTSSGASPASFVEAEMSSDEDASGLKQRRHEDEFQDAMNGSAEAGSPRSEGFETLDHS